MARSNPDFLNGVPELLVLRLIGQQPMHGYELVQAIASTSGQALAFGEGCIYPVLHKLEKQGLLRGAREHVGGRRRVVYHLTKDGTARLAALVEQWDQVVAAVRQVLGGEHERVALDRSSGTPVGEARAAAGVRAEGRERAA
jgi:PadR family transcriptional regulator PadR